MAYTLIGLGRYQLQRHPFDRVVPITATHDVSASKLISLELISWRDRSKGTTASSIIIDTRIGRRIRISGENILVPLNVRPVQVTTHGGCSNTTNRAS